MRWTACGAAAAVLIASMATVVGCGGGGPALAPVSGTVTYKGQPLEKGEINFYPASGRPAAGKIVGGRIVDVTTLRANDGAPVGKCQVTIVAVERSDDINVPSRWLIPPRYGDVKQSGLEAEIKAGQTNQLEFALAD